MFAGGCLSLSRRFTAISRKKFERLAALQPQVHPTHLPNHRAYRSSRSKIWIDQLSHLIALRVQVSDGMAMNIVLL